MSPPLRGNSHRIERTIPAVELREGLFKNGCKSWLIALKWGDMEVKIILGAYFTLKLGCCGMSVQVNRVMIMNSTYLADESQLNKLHSQLLHVLI